MLLSTLERQPHLTSSSKKHSHLINHPLDPCCLCWCLERNINIPMSCLRSCPSKLEFFLSFPKRKNRKEPIPTLWLTQCCPFVALSCGVSQAWNFLGMVGELNRCTCCLALSFTIQVWLLFHPSSVGRTFQCLGVGRKYLNLFTALATHCSKRSLLFYIYPVPCK